MSKICYRRRWRHFDDLSSCMSEFLISFSSAASLEDQSLGSAYVCSTWTRDSKSNTSVIVRELELRLYFLWSNINTSLVNTSQPPHQSHHLSSLSWILIQVLTRPPVTRIWERDWRFGYNGRKPGNVSTWFNNNLTKTCLARLQFELVCQGYFIPSNFRYGLRVIWSVQDRSYQLLHDLKLFGHDRGWQESGWKLESTPNSHKQCHIRVSVGPALLLSTKYLMEVSEQTFILLRLIMYELGYNTDNYPSAVLNGIFFLARRE